MNKKYLIQNEKFNTWEHLLQALEDEYTISLKDVCKMLKVSRNWVNEYIRPYVKAIYISNGYGAGKTDWVKIASIELNKPFTESLWFHEKDFYSYVYKNISSVTKQVKKVPKVYFMTDENRKEYLDEYAQIQKNIEMENNIKKKLQMIKTLGNCDRKYIKDDIDIKKMIQDKAIHTKRNDTCRISVPMPDIAISEWQAVHDIKEYGDIDETIYRKLFMEGYIRIELKFPDKTNTNIGNRIYYVPDPEPIKANLDNNEYYYIKQEHWEKFIRKNA